MRALPRGVLGETTASAPGNKPMKSHSEPCDGSSVSVEDLGPLFRGSMAPASYPRSFLSSCSKLGKRVSQEDRCVVYPRVLGRDDVQMFAVFDGTVGDHAADFAHNTLGHQICSNIHFKKALSLTSGSSGSFGRVATVASCVEAAVHEGFRDTDAAIIRSCSAGGAALDYASTTAAVALVTGDLLTVAHLGDSKVVLGRVLLPGSGSAAPTSGSSSAAGTRVCGVYLTTDHKPDQPAEHRRIAAAGGTLEYLSGGRPFIRGGDFAARQAAGGRPMQLNYSRALGGKDLKPWGLSSTPDVRQVHLTPADRLVIAASDGVWDVATADVAAGIAWDAFVGGRDPAAEITDWCLRAHEMRGSIDNVTAVVAILR